MVLSPEPEMELAVKYSGPDADRGRMGVLELGPAMIGMGQMVGEASRILFGDATRVRVEVQADFRHASFGIEFFAVPTPPDLIASLNWQELAAIAALLGLSAKYSVKGLIQIVRWQRGRKIERVERTGDQVRITTVDGENNLVTINEYKIFVNPDARKGLKALAAPLESEGVTELQIAAEDMPPIVIPREERSSFLSAPMPEQEVSIDSYRAVLEIVSPTFRQGNKWRFAQGGNTFFAEIVDEDFLAKVAKREEIFGAGDALRCDIEVRTTRADDGFHFEHRIVKVIERIASDHDSLPPLL